MTSEAGLIAAAHASYIGSFRTLATHLAAGEVRSIQPVFAFVTGIPVALFNGCVVAAPATPRDLREALEWVHASGLSHQVALADSLPDLADLAAVAAAAGLVRQAVPLPGMILDPVPEAPEPAPGVTVTAGTAPGLADYLPAAFSTDPDVRVFTGRLDGQPVGSSIAIRTGDVAGVYGVETRPEARRRGVATATTWAAVEAGRAWGCAPIVLQATELGRPVYERMGFRTVVRYQVWTSEQRSPVRPGPGAAGSRPTQRSPAR